MCSTVCKGYAKRGAVYWYEDLRKFVKQKKRLWKKELHQPENSDDWKPKNVEYKFLNKKTESMAYMNKKNGNEDLGRNMNNSFQENNKQFWK